MSEKSCLRHDKEELSLSGTLGKELFLNAWVLNAVEGSALGESLSPIELWEMVGEGRALRSKMKTLNRAKDQAIDSKSSEEDFPVSPPSSLPTQEALQCLPVTHRRQPNVRSRALRNCTLCTQRLFHLCRSDALSFSLSSCVDAAFCHLCAFLCL